MPSNQPRNIIKGYKMLTRYRYLTDGLQDTKIESKLIKYNVFVGEELSLSFPLPKIMFM